MELVIKVSEEVYKKAKKMYDMQCDCAWLGIKYGTPLPKGHGRLIDADALPLNDIDDANYGSNYIRIAPTIIEADRRME